MDLDADGINDILSGCYSEHDPMAGLFYVLRGQKGGGFDAPAIVRGTDGKPLIARPGAGNDDDDALLENICTRPFAIDWNGDGKLDIVSGNFKGTFSVFVGEGDGRFKPGGTPLMTTEGTKLQTDGVHSDPFIVDWDGDGDLDLLASSHTGAIVWSENRAIVKGETDASASAFPAKLAPFKTLIAARNGGDAGGAYGGDAEYYDAIGQAYELLEGGKPDWGAAAAAFRKLIESAPDIGDGYYHLACCHARFATTVEGEARDAAIQRAIAELKRAVEKGWRNTEHMATDPDMTVLRGRDDYKSILASLKQDAPKGPGDNVRIHVVDFDGDGKLDILAGDCVNIDGQRIGQVWLYRGK